MVFSVLLSNISITEGIKPLSIILFTHIAASSRFSKYAKFNNLVSGYGINFKVAFVISPKVPSEPTKKFVKL